MLHKEKAHMEELNPIGRHMRSAAVSHIWTSITLVKLSRCSFGLDRISQPSGKLVDLRRTSALFDVLHDGLLNVVR